MTDNRRVLLVDDMPTIHEDFRKILSPALPGKLALAAAEAALFGDPLPAEPASGNACFELDSAYQGQEGLAKLQEALAAGRPYALAFVDMRMPPGWDGVETILRLWEADPELQVVICTAYSDASWDEILTRLDTRDRLLILKKPFDTIEVLQLANALCAKWNAVQQVKRHVDQLEQRVAERTEALTQANASLKQQIEERKRLESQLVQAEKLASIGQLAAGVAHEINNPIGYIASNFNTLNQYAGQLFEMISAYEAAEPQLPAAACERLRALREQLEIGFLREDVPGLLAESREGLDRVKKIVQDLKDFSRVDSQHAWELADLHKGIDSTLNIVASELRYKAEVVKDYGELPAVECLPSQINQVVMNLLTNAAQAMGPQRGRITVRTRAVGGQVQLEVADTGKGIAPEHLPRIFDPFFTTKPVGQGTGLGLSLCHGIVQRHGGRIEVASTPGEGTIFCVVLPVRQGVAPPAADDRFQPHVPLAAKAETLSQLAG